MAVPERPVLVAPDSFKGTFNAAQVAAAIGRGLERAGLMPPDLCPVADGGEGTLDALLPQLGGELIGVEAGEDDDAPLGGEDADGGLQGLEVVPLEPGGGCGLSAHVGQGM